jgi:hypothetical protein
MPRMRRERCSWHGPWEALRCRWLGGRCERDRGDIGNRGDLQSGVVAKIESKGGVGVAKRQ